jgi:hypothetical protein
MTDMLYRRVPSWEGLDVTRVQPPAIVVAQLIVVAIFVVLYLSQR